MLTRINKSLKDIIDVLKAYQENIGDVATSSTSAGKGDQPPNDDDAPPQKEIIGHLIASLEGC